MEINQYNFNYKQIVMDEIALEGLEGIGINLLWARVEHRILNSLTPKIKIKLWTFIASNNSIKLYQLHVAAAYFQIKDRFQLVHKESGHLLDDEEYLDGPYEFHSIDKEYGSCQHYHTRTVITKEEIATMSYDKVLEMYGEKLVIVASIEERWHALAPHSPTSTLELLTPIMFCILELIGKARENGQLTIGNTNLTKIVKDPKLLFYYRKRLGDLNLINSTTISLIINERRQISLFLRLNRFYTPKILIIPKVGKLHDIVQHLQQMPSNKDNIHNMIKKSLLDSKMSKKLQKTLNIFKFEEEVVVDKNGKSCSRKFISLNAESGESSGSDDENDTTPLKCRYKIGINRIKQAYECVLDAGLKGLTQLEIGQMLGIDFYSSRAICRSFKARKLVREFLEDKGRQRIARYIAIAATGEMDKEYVAEKQKFLDYLASTSNVTTDEAMAESVAKDKELELRNVDSDEVPLKKRKLNNTDMVDDPQENIIEVKSLLESDSNKPISEALRDSMKLPPLKLLKYANGVIKIIRDCLVVSGVTNLSQLLMKETSQPSMDSKSMKRFFEKLAADGQLHIYKLKWPGYKEKYTILFCAPHIKKDDPRVLSAYKDICMAQKRLRHKPISRKKDDTNRPKENKLCNFTYPRYMKVQKLHQFLFNLVYLNSDIVELRERYLPEGFASLANVIPEMPVDLAVGHISAKKMYELQDIKISDIISNKKLRNVPQNVYQTILYSKSFTNCLRSSLEILASFGLIQICFKTDSVIDYHGGLQRYIFYLNRNAKVINTEGSWPRAEADIASLEKCYYFENMDDVNIYWREVYGICTNTIVKVEKRDCRYIPKVPIRSYEEVQYYDTGIRYGDGCGPGGFHSSFFMERPQLWKLFSILPCTVKVMKTKSLPKPKPKPKAITVKAKKYKIKTKKPALIKPFELKSVEQRSVKLKKSRAKEISVTWNKWEDNILLYSKVAMAVMSPIIQPGTAQITNLVTKDLISIYDNKKTPLHCFKRGRFLEMNPSFVCEKQQLINEIRRRLSILADYDGLLRKLRLKHSVNLTKYINEARYKSMELVWVIRQISKGSSFNYIPPCVALSLEDLYQNFRVTLPAMRKTPSLYTTPPECPVEVGTLKEGIILVVNVGFFTSINVDMSTIIYNIFKDYSEVLLRTATEQLHKSGAVSVRDKSINSQLQKLSCSDIVQYSAGYKISAFYQRRWFNRLNTTFIDIIATYLQSFPPNNNIKGSPEVCCFLCELQCCGALDLVTTKIPILNDSNQNENSLGFSEIELKMNFKSGNVGWNNSSKVEKIADIFNDIDCEKAILLLIRNALVHGIEEINSTVDKELVVILNKAREEGKTFNELKEIIGCTADDLKRRLTTLEDKHIIKRIGYYENRVVLSEFLEPWCLAIDNVRLIPSPWMMLGPKISYSIFTKWCGTIMNKIFENPGFSVAALADYFDYITPRSVQEICVFLEKCKCITMKTLHVSEPNLFSEDIETRLTDFNEYDDPQCLVVFPVRDSITKYAYVWKCIKQYCVDP